MDVHWCWDFFLLIFYIKSPLLHFFTLTTPSPRKDEEMWKLFQKFVSFLSSFPCAQSCDKSISSFSQRENGRKISFASHAPRFLFLLVCCNAVLYAVSCLGMFKVVKFQRKRFWHKVTHSNDFIGCYEQIQER